MIVYRVETSLGHGPYFHVQPGSDEWEIAIEAHRKGNPELHPDWRDDGMFETYNRLMVFGFESLPAMKSWFNGAERLYLGMHGLLCSCYVAWRVALGRKQLAFYRQDSTLLWQKPLNHF